MHCRKPPVITLKRVPQLLRETVADQTRRGVPDPALVNARSFQFCTSLTKRDHVYLWLQKRAEQI